MPSIWRSNFLSTFHYRPRVSVDVRGIEEWGALVGPVACRYQPSTKLIRDSTGEQVVEEAILFTETAVPKEALVWLPGVAPPEDPDDTSGSLKPLAVFERRTLLSSAVDHYEVHL